MPNASILNYNGLRCTKIPRRSAASPTPSRISPSNSADSTGSSASSSSTGSVDAGDSTDSTNSTPSLSIHASTANTSPQSFLVTSTTTTAAVDANSLSNQPHSSSTHASSHISDLSLLFPSTRSTSLPTLPGLRASPTGISPTSHSTVATNTSASDPSSDSTHDPSRQSSHSRKGSHLETILGSTLGSLVFLALALLVGFLVFRHRRRASYKKRGGASQRLLQPGRNSTAPTSSCLQFQSPLSSVHSFDHHGLKPFSPTSPFDSHPDDVSNMAQIDNPAFLLSQQRPPHPGSDFRPGLHFVSAHTSQQSLGSTIILPGRSSMGSSQPGRESDQPSTPGLPPTRSRASTVRHSARSDPFDLEAPPSVHRQDRGMDV